MWLKGGSRPGLALISTIFILVAAGAILCVRRPGLDRTGNVLRPQRGEAERALDEIKSEIGLPPDPLWLIVSGRDERQVYQGLTLAEGLLNGAVSNRVIGGYLLPTALWPRAELQAANRATAAVLGRQGAVFREAALREGFRTNALALTEGLVRTWARAGAGAGVLWPTNEASQWLLKRFVARAPGQLLAMGLVYPGTNRVEVAALAELSSRLSHHQAFLSGWELLGSTTLKRVQRRLWPMVAPMVVLVLASLWLAFRRPREILLGLAVLLLSGLCLLATMGLAGWSWNLLNLMAAAADLGHRRGLQHFHAIGAAPPWRGPRPGSTLGRAGAVAVRSHGDGRIWLVGLFEQPGHGQPGQGVCRGHWSQYGVLGLPPPRMVALGRE